MREGAQPWINFEKRASIKCLGHRETSRVSWPAASNNTTNQEPESTEPRQGGITNEF